MSRTRFGRQSCVRHLGPRQLVLEQRAGQGARQVEADHGQAGSEHRLEAHRGNVRPPAPETAYSGGGGRGTPSPTQRKPRPGQTPRRGSFSSQIHVQPQHPGYLEPRVLTRVGAGPCHPGRARPLSGAAPDAGSRAGGRAPPERRGLHGGASARLSDTTPR